MGKKKKDNGWIKIHRSITNNPLWLSEKFSRAQAWVDLLLMVNHTDRKLVFEDGTELIVRPGQHFTSIGHLAERWKWSQNRVIRFLSYLENHQMIHRVGTRRGTLVTVEKWAFYQYGRRPDETPDETPDGTSDETPDGTQTRMNNKNDNKNVIQEIAAPPQTNSRGDILE